MKRLLSVLALFSMLFFMLLPLASAKEVSVLMQENLEKAYENVLCSAVCIRGEDYCGSGSIFIMDKDEIIIVTNRHVIQYFDSDSRVVFFNGAQCCGRVLGFSESADIGFISVREDELDRDDKRELRAVGKREAAYDELKKNSCFFMIDMASDPADPVIYKGAVVDKARYLADYGMEMLYGDGAAIPGMSGSGIFDYCGNYIGTLSGATDQYELAGVPLKTVLSEYKKARFT